MRVIERAKEIVCARENVVTWVRANGYTAEDITFCYPWTPLETVEAAMTRFIVRLRDTERIPVLPDYHCIFEIPRLTIYERRVGDTLRQGLSTPQKRELLRFARAILVSSYDTESVPPKPLSPNLFPKALLQEKCVVDVAWYVDGRARGSMVAQGSLWESVADAAEQLTHDRRFKPVSQEECQSAIIEMTVTTGPWITLMQSDLAVSRAYHHLMHRVDHAGCARGWFVPNVCLLPGHSTELGLVNRLIYSKAGLTQEQTQRAVCKVATGSVFFEDEEKPRPIAEDRAAFEQNLCTHILSTIDASGFVRCRTDLAGTYAQCLDAVRTAFTWHTLNEYCTTGRADPTVDEAARRISAFYDSIREDLSTADRTLGDIYMHRPEAMQMSINELRTWFTTNGPFLPLQWLRLRYFATEGQPEKADDSTLLQLLYSEWERTHNTASLALFADLAPVLRAAGCGTQAAALVNWYRELQCSDGSFPDVPDSNFVYTRGTSKILESLALMPGTADTIDQGLRWLRSMQYTPARLYNIPTYRQPVFRYGLQHDHWGQSVWVDSACHTLLALVRSRI